MPELLFNLRNVPDDEQAEVRQLLADNTIEFYETSAGFWGIGTVAIWLKTDRQLSQAKQLLHEYQITRQQAAQQAYSEAKANGEIKNVYQMFKQQPVTISVYLLIIAALLTFMLAPFVHF